MRLKTPEPKTRRPTNLPINLALLGRLIPAPVAARHNALMALFRLLAADPTAR